MSFKTDKMSHIFVIRKQFKRGDIYKKKIQVVRVPHRTLIALLIAHIGKGNSHSLTRIIVVTHLLAKGWQGPNKSTKKIIFFFQRFV